MQMVLRGIVEKLKRRRGLNPVAGFFQQDEIQRWIADQNQTIDHTFRALVIQILVAHARQMTETRARQERDLDEILTRIRSQLHSEPALDSGLVGEALELAAQRAAPRTHTPQRLRSSRTPLHPPTLPPFAPPELSFHGLIPPSPPEGIQEDLTFRVDIHTIPHPEPIFWEENGKLYGNAAGLINHLLQTDDEHFKQVLLGTYLDFATPEDLFDIITKKYEDARPEIGHFVKLLKIVNVIVSWVQTLPPEWDILFRVREFVDAPHYDLIPDHRRMILNAIPSPTPTLPARRGLTVEPIDPGELANALTHMEGDLHKTIRWIDYLSYWREEPSRLNIVLSNHDKMIRWVKYSVLRHDEIQDRATAVKRFATAAKECLRRRNYNSMAAIAKALDWKSRPMSDLPRTMALVSNKTRSSFEKIIAMIDQDENFKSYKRITKTEAGYYIPWFTAQLADVKAHLLPYPRTVDDLINFEHYQQLARKLPMYPVTTEVEEDREERHLAYLRNQFDTNVFDDAEAETQRRRKLKRKEEEDHRNRRPQLKSLGF
ncbi:ras guanine nucleotide exchange factor domain-containing protein [Mycena latifolia]|nr:ras guanine nucleotide exchange factor domain-containing protein [Mycena latifolia]